MFLSSDIKINEELKDKLNKELSPKFNSNVDINYNRKIDELDKYFKDTPKASS
jgi:hypothetical protein